MQNYRALSCRSWSIAQQCSARLPIHILNYWTELSEVLFFKLVVFWSATLPIVDLWQCCAGYLSILWAVHCLCRMCRRVLLVVLWMLIGTRLHLLAVELLSTVEPLCSSQCLFGTILVTLYLMVSDWRVLRAEPMLSCWPNLLFFLSPTIFSVFSIHGLVMWACGLWIDRMFSLSPFMYSWLYYYYYYY